MGKAKGGSLFHTTWYLRPFTDRLGVHVLRDGAGQIEAGLVLTVSRFLGATSTRRLEWAPYNGPLIRASTSESPTEKITEERQRMLRLLAGSPRVSTYDYCLPPDCTDLMPFLWNGFDTLVGYTYQIPPAEDWPDAMAASHRRDLRKAHQVLQEAGGTVDAAPRPDEFYDLFCQTAEVKEFRSRGPAGREAFARWWGEVASRDAGRIYVAREAGGEPVCATLLVWDHACGYYLASGIRPDARRGPMNLWSRVLIDRMIRDTHARGLTFDFEGSVVPGVERFFRGWGGRQVTKYRVVKIRRPWTFAAWSLHRYWTRHRRKWLASD